MVSLATSKSPLLMLADKDNQYGYRSDALSSYEYAPSRASTLAQNQRAARLFLESQPLVQSFSL